MALLEEITPASGTVRPRNKVFLSSLNFAIDFGARTPGFRFAAAVDHLRHRSQQHVRRTVFHFYQAVFHFVIPCSLFGEKYEPEWYNEVVSACQMADDMKLFEHGDLSMIGERGVTLRYLWVFFPKKEVGLNFLADSVEASGRVLHWPALFTASRRCCCWMIHSLQWTPKWLQPSFPIVLWFGCVLYRSQLTARKSHVFPSVLRA
jgi:hypothetical protein